MASSPFLSSFTFCRCCMFVVVFVALVFFLIHAYVWIDIHIDICTYVHTYKHMCVHTYIRYVLPLIFKTILNIWVTLIYSVDNTTQHNATQYWLYHKRRIASYYYTTWDYFDSPAPTNIAFKNCCPPTSSLSSSSVRSSSSTSYSTIVAVCRFVVMFNFHLRVLVVVVVVVSSSIHSLLDFHWYIQTQQPATTKDDEQTDTQTDIYADNLNQGGRDHACRHRVVKQIIQAFESSCHITCCLTNS